MRQFILGKSVTYTTQTTLDKVESGAVAFFYNKDGQLTLSKNGAGLDKESMLVLGRPSIKGGPVVLPVYKNNFSYSKSVFADGKQFAANTIITAPTKIGTYSVIIVLKGKKFNERNKYTASVYVKDTTMSAATLRNELMKKLNSFKHLTGITASASSTSTLDLKGDEKGVDYNVICADELTGLKVTITQTGDTATNDANMIADLYCKAAADRGIEYTYKDAEEYLYPEYPLNPLANPDAVDTGFTVFTLRFAEPRAVKTRDEVVNQIIQVVFPTGAGQITQFEAICKVLAGGTIPPEAA